MKGKLKNEMTDKYFSKTFKLWGNTQIFSRFNMIHLDTSFKNTVQTNLNNKGMD